MSFSPNSISCKMSYTPLCALRHILSKSPYICEPLASLDFMKYSIDKEKQYSILKLEEANLNSLISPNLKSEFIFLRNEGVKNLILDLQQVQYVDSSGLSAILTANRLWTDHGAFVLGGALQAGVKKIIEISRLDSILTIIPTIEEAVDFVFLEEIERNLGAAMEEE